MGFQDNILLAPLPKGRLIACPYEEIFARDDHIGTVYEWDDGTKQTIWFDCRVPIAQCVFRKVGNRGSSLADIF